ncbi:hypothetical protein CP97_07420 [Aurantiacibacter atlanticus]|uniref:DUF4105 domain-containing protein n=2 Tax=Aurantiacibacter atlanticus TaxID=1648404 RepID=A0A0H4VXP8_9SPHN|nr:hypothetical protein CP97_07420 [Aurantiacibacter atlanticus]
MLAVMGIAMPASAQVDAHFHSFNGSVLWGRYPHTFVVFEGRMEDGTVVNENFGFSARNTSAAITSGPAEHMILTETERTIGRTNRHFSITLTDAEYRRMKVEVIAWRDYPGPYYDLDDNNCIHFVARLAELAGLDVDVPEQYLRRPKAWLNYIARRNPQLGVEEIS